MNKYLKAINESLELNHKQNETNTLTLRLLREDLIAQMKKIQIQIEQIDTQLNLQNKRDERYEKVVNITNNNCTVAENMINEKIGAITTQGEKVVNASDITTVNL